MAQPILAVLCPFLVEAGAPSSVFEGGDFLLRNVPSPIPYYNSLGYEHYDCNCDSSYDKAAWAQFKAGGAGPDILGDTIEGLLAGWVTGAIRGTTGILAAGAGTEGGIQGGVEGGVRGGIAPVQKGAAGAEKAVAEVQAEGGQVLGREITIENSAGRARVDFVYIDSEGNLRLGEAKNGPTARLSTNQKAVYSEFQRTGGNLIGGNARAAGLPTSVGPTSVRVFKY